MAQIEGFKAPTNDEINNTNGRSADELATNIADKTLDVLRDIAVANDMAIITRPVNPIAFAHMQRGAAGKNMFVHGKSAPEGTIAQGLIPMQSSISKAGKDNNVDKIKTYNEENAHSISYSEEKFKEIEAKLKQIVQDRKSKGQAELDKEGLLQEAKIAPEAFDPLVSKVPLLDKKGNQVYIFEDNQGRALRDENQNPIYAIKQESKFQLINVNHEPINPKMAPEAALQLQRCTPVAIEVIGKPQIEIAKDGSLNITKVSPITADIDILAYGARINLQEFDKIISHSEAIRQEKETLIKNSNITLPDNIKKDLANSEIDGLLNSDKLPQTLKTTKDFQKLASDLKQVEVLRENLRGMGEGSDVAMAITGHMRAEFKDKVEISHGAEQFNIHFTQPKDTEWVVIDNKGKVSTIKGEKELLNKFNEFKKEGLSMPPNPNWGWKLNGGKYEIDEQLCKASKECDSIRLQVSSAGQEQKAQIKEILELQTKVGIAAITDPRNETEFAKNKEEFLEQIEVHNDKYLKIKHNKEQKTQVEPTVSSVEASQIISKNHVIQKKVEAIKKRLEQGANKYTSNMKIASISKQEKNTSFTR